MKKAHILGMVLAAVVVAYSAAVLADAKDRGSDIWLESKLATTYLLNEYLNPFRLDVEVDDGVAYLSGTVDSDVAKDLAIEIAKGTEGIREVKSNIDVKKEVNKAQASAGSRPDNASPARAQDDGNDFFRTVTDATITAAVKSKLLWNDNTEGLNINVDTTRGTVTLKGEVPSKANKDLAEQIARNTNGVQKVENQLQIRNN